MVKWIIIESESDGKVESFILIRSVGIVAYKAGMHSYETCGNYENMKIMRENLEVSQITHQRARMEIHRHLRQVPSVNLEGIAHS